MIHRLAAGQGQGTCFAMVRRAVGRYAGAVAVNSSRQPLLWLAGRIWNLGQSLWDLALPTLIVLIVLKLTGVIAWSWWWVLAPLWIVGIIVLTFLCLLVAGIWSSRHLYGLVRNQKNGGYSGSR